MPKKWEVATNLFVPFFSQKKEKALSNMIKKRSEGMQIRMYQMYDKSPSCFFKHLQGQANQMVKEVISEPLNINFESNREPWGARNTEKRKISLHIQKGEKRYYGYEGSRTNCQVAYIWAFRRLLRYWELEWVYQEQTIRVDLSLLLTKQFGRLRECFQFTIP